MPKIKDRDVKKSNLLKTKNLLKGVLKKLPLKELSTTYFQKFFTIIAIKVKF